MTVSDLATSRLSRRRLIELTAAASSITAIDRVMGPWSPPVAAAPVPLAARNQGATPTPVTSVVGDDASPAFRVVAGALAEAMAQVNLPGAALGILADGREEHATFGLADVAGGEPVSDQTLFQIGSLSKTFTGTAIMRLVDQGLVDIDATVRTYLPTFSVADASVSERVTVRQLLTHTAGWFGDLFVDTGSGDDAGARFVDEVMPGLPQLSPLGALFSYNNTCFFVLGQIMEAVTGGTYRAAISALVLDPLGMAESTFDPDQVMAGSYARAYADDDGVLQDQTLDLPRAIDAAGGLRSTTRDLIRYARFHLGDGTADGQRLLSPYTLDLMQTSQVPVPGTPELSMGMNWLVQEQSGVKLVSHSGDTFGQHTDFWFLPADGLVITILTNAAPGGAAAAAAAFAAAAEAYPALAPLLTASGDSGSASPSTPVATPVSATSAATPAAGPVDTAAYAGRYERPDVVFTFAPQADGLTLKIETITLPEAFEPAVGQELPSDLPVELVGPDLAALTVLGQSLPLPFIRRPDGQVGYIGFGLRLVPRTGDA